MFPCDHTLGTVLHDLNIDQNLTAHVLWLVEEGRSAEAVLLLGRAAGEDAIPKVYARLNEAQERQLQEKYGYANPEPG